jgi:parvulin-like peptidyl-prolyl isomerase
LDEEMVELGWLGKSQLADRFGPLFAEMVFSAEAGLFPEPVPTSFGVAVVEVLDHEVRPLDQADQEERRVELFDRWLADLREEGDIENLWEANMVPRGL